MKLADVETLIWLIVAAVVLIAKGWGKLQEQIGKDSSAGSEETPPAERPRPPRPQPRKASGPGPAGARPVPSRTRPATSPTPRGAQPAQPATPTSRSAPEPVGSPTPREAWRVDPEQIRRFMEQLSGQPRQEDLGQAPPAPPPVAHAPVHHAKAPPQPPKPAHKPEPTPIAHVPQPAMAAAPVASHAVTTAPAPSSPSRTSLWAEALRDKQNIRNIIISYEIIGPPKAM